DFRIFLFPGQQIVAAGTILSDRLSIRTGMGAVMASKTSGEVFVADIIRIGPPCYVYFRIHGGGVNSLNLADSFFELLTVCIEVISMVAAVVLSQSLCHLFNRPQRITDLLKNLYAGALDKRNVRTDSPFRQSFIHGRARELVDMRRAVVA